MMDYGSNAPGYGNLNQEQWNQLEQLNRQFYEETIGLRNDLRAKTYELNTLLNTRDSDPNKARALEKEIGELRAKLDEKELNYEIEARKIAPESERYGGSWLTASSKAYSNVGSFEGHSKSLNVS